MGTDSQNSILSTVIDLRRKGNSFLEKEYFFSLFALLISVLSRGGKSWVGGRYYFFAFGDKQLK